MRARCTISCVDTAVFSSRRLPRGRGFAIRQHLSPQGLSLESQRFWLREPGRTLRLRACHGQGDDPTCGRCRSGSKFKLREKAQYNIAHSRSHPFFVEINKYSHAVVSTRSYMGPEQMDSPRCLEKGNCVPIGGHSVWARSEKSAKSITVVATSLDGIGEFYGDTSDALGVGVTLAVALSMAAALANRTSEFLESELVFAFFQGESWGRVGSRMFLRDLRHFTCANRINATVSPFNDAICASPLKVVSLPLIHV